MSLKSVEMQIAIPRTKDAGLHQNQLLQKPMQDQTLLAATAQQQSEKLLNQAAKLSEAVPMKVKDESEEHRKRKNKNPSDSKHTKQLTVDPDNADHPYKGKHIDFSL